MTEKKYITGADVLRALADGKRVRMRDGVAGYLRLSDGVLTNALGLPARCVSDFTGDWEIVEEPATDAELVAEMRRRASFSSTSKWHREVWLLAADMLEKRSFK